MIFENLFSQIHKDAMLIAHNLYAIITSQCRRVGTVKILLARKIWHSGPIIASEANLKLCPGGPCT